MEILSRSNDNNNNNNKDVTVLWIKQYTLTGKSEQIGQI
jgi:hypothetical protein